MAKKAPFICTFTFEKRFKDYGYCISENKNDGNIIMEKSGYSTSTNARRGYRRIIKKLRIPAGVIEIKK